MKYLTLLLALLLSACAKENHQDTPLKIYVIGDSISIGYTEALKSRVAIEHTPENARNSSFTRAMLETWLLDLDPSFTTIIWNNGMWDCHNPEKAASQDYPEENWYTTNELYRENLLAIGTKLKETGLKIYFPLTTDIPSPQGGFLYSGCEVEKNKIAIEVMSFLGIKVIDLYSVNLGKPDVHMYGFDIHYTKEGYENLANKIMESL